MKKTILIAPAEHGIAAALAEAVAAAGFDCFLGCADRAPSAPAQSRDTSKDGPIKRLSWNPGSYIATAAMLLSLENASTSPDAAFIISDLGAAPPDLLESPPGAFLSALESRVAGAAYLSRELAKRFQARRSGKLFLISVEAPNAPPLGPSAALFAGAFRGLGEGFFAASRESPWSCYGIMDKSGKEEAAAKFCLRLLEDPKANKAGRWLPFTGKPGLFGMFGAEGAT